MRAFSSFLLPVLAVLFLMVGCGGGSGSPSTGSSPTPTPLPPGTRLVKVFSVTPATVSAAGGQTVTILGEGFSGRTALDLNVPFGAITVVSDTEIRFVTVPRGFTGSSTSNLVIIQADGISSLDVAPRVFLTTVK